MKTIRTCTKGHRYTSGPPCPGCHPRALKEKKKPEEPTVLHRGELGKGAPCNPYQSLLWEDQPFNRSMRTRMVSGRKK